MITPETEIHRLNQKVERLEKQHAWLKRVLLLGSVVIGGVVLLGLLPNEDAVSAKQFILKDKNGKTRAMLGVDEKFTGLGIYGEDGTVRAGFGET